MTAVLFTGKRDQLYWTPFIRTSKRLAAFLAVLKGLYLLFTVGAVTSEDLALSLTEDLRRMAKQGIER